MPSLSCAVPSGGDLQQVLQVEVLTPAELMVEAAQAPTYSVAVVLPPFENEVQAKSNAVMQLLTMQAGGKAWRYQPIVQIIGNAWNGQLSGKGRIIMFT